MSVNNVSDSPFDVPFELGQRWHQFTNSSGETVPAYGVIKVTGSTDGVLTATKPDTTLGTYFFNGPQLVANGERGVCTLASPHYAIYDSADGTPAAGEVWGPAASTFKIRKRQATSITHLGPNFVIVGEVDTTTTTSLVRVRETEHKIRGKFNGTLSPAGSVAFSVWVYNGSAEADTGTDVTVYDWMLQSGQALYINCKATAFWDAASGRYYVDAAECPCTTTTTTTTTTSTSTTSTSTTTTSTSTTSTSTTTTTPAGCSTCGMDYPGDTITLNAGTLTNDACSDCNNASGAAITMTITGIDCQWESEVFTLCEENARWIATVGAGPYWQVVLSRNSGTVATYLVTDDCTLPVTLDLDSENGNCNVPATVELS